MISRSSDQMHSTPRSGWALARIPSDRPTGPAHSMPQRRKETHQCQTDDASSRTAVEEDSAAVKRSERATGAWSRYDAWRQMGAWTSQTQQLRSVREVYNREELSQVTLDGADEETHSWRMQYLKDGGDGTVQQRYGTVQYSTTMTSLDSHWTATCALANFVNTDFEHLNSAWVPQLLSVLLHSHDGRAEGKRSMKCN